MRRELVVVVLACVACGNTLPIGDATDVLDGGKLGTDGGTVGADSGPSIPVTDLAAALLTAYCERITQCPGLIGGFTFAGMDTCRAIFGDALDTDGWVTAINAGTIVYDPGQAGACLQAMTATCGFQKAPEPAVCETAMAGQLDVGKPCTLDAQCKGAWCRKVDAGCPGTCVAYRHDGEDCFGDAKCADGLYCIDLKCSTGAWGGKDGACSKTEDCDPTSFCLGGGSTGHCVPRAGEGQACQYLWECAEGLVCAKSGTQSVCVQGAKAGESCATATCAHGLKCVHPPSGAPPTCLAFVAPGGSCTATSECLALDTWCTGPAGARTCQPLPQAGSPCASPDSGHPLACAPPAVCNGTVCGDKLAKDAPCVANGIFDPCAAGLTCANGKCVPIPVEGEHCSKTCAPGLNCAYDKIIKDFACQKPVCK